jgi:septal ring factor EnvC (AmiA/AmiB activator)
MMKGFCYLRPYQVMQGIGIIMIILIFMLVGCASTPPTEQMAVAKDALNTAISAGGNEFAPVQLRSAMDKMDAAEKAMGEKEYEQARQLAEQAQVDAQLATTTARAAKAQKAVRELEEGNRTLQQEIERQAQ